VAKGIVILLIDQIKLLTEITKRLTVFFGLAKGGWLTGQLEGGEKINKITRRINY
jgi:hypothetical protein